jgi:hypothetical protein
MGMREFKCQEYSTTVVTFEGPGLISTGMPAISSYKRLLSYATGGIVSFTGDLEVSEALIDISTSTKRGERLSIGKYIDKRQKEAAKIVLSRYKKASLASSYSQALDIICAPTPPPMLDRERRRMIRWLPAALSAREPSSSQVHCGRTTKRVIKAKDNLEDLTIAYGAD